MTLTAENGRVSIVDSREKNVRHIIEADYFISKICNDLLQIPLMVSVCMQQIFKDIDVNSKLLDERKK